MKNLLPIIFLLLTCFVNGQVLKDTSYNTAGDTTLRAITTFISIKCDTARKYDTATIVKKYVAPVVIPVRSNLRFEYTSENTDALTKFAVNLPYNWNSLGKCCGYSITRSADFARSGKFSTRYELNKTDPDIYASKRTEAARASNDEPTLAERWYGASYYPKDWVNDPAPELVTQWQSLKGVSPPLALWSNNGNWEVVLFGVSHKVIGALESNKWTDFVFHVKWSTGADGLIEIWKDGIKQPSISGANTYSGYPGNYMKNGIYKWPWAHPDKYTSKTTKRVIYIDDVRIGSSYKDVAPGN